MATDRLQRLSDPVSTRERLLTEAMGLFAAQGYRGTTVGDIEAAAGLSPRAGGLYKHFPSKLAVLEAGIQRHVGDVDEILGLTDILPLEDLRSELVLLAHWLLAELEREREMMLILQRDGHQFEELVSDFHERVVKRGYDLAEDWIRGRIGARLPESVDARAMGAVAVSSLVQFRTSAALLGVTPGETEEREFTDAWVELWARAIDSFGADSNERSGR